MATACILGCPWLIPQTVFPQTARSAASNRINLLFIGTGRRGMELLRLFIAQPDCHVAAVCDVDQEHAETAKDFVNDRYGTRDCRVYYDFREPLARSDLDAAVIALPLHWHSIPAVMAARAGLDVYAEPPLAHTIKEGRTICKTIERYARVWQTDTWRRADQRLQHAAELVRSGAIGAIQSVEIGISHGHVDCAGTAGQETPAKPPPGLDYDMWLGPAPWAPYAPARVHGNWRWNLDYGGGQLMEWIGHYMEIVQLVLGLDTTGPTEVEGSGEYPAAGLWNAPTTFSIRALYSTGLTITIVSAQGIREGILWKGEKESLHMNRDGSVEYLPRSSPQLAKPKTFVPAPVAHAREFLDCARSRRLTSSPAESAQRAATVGHLGQIAIRLGRKIRWNPITEEIIGDDTAGRLLGKSMREPWYL
ncbi:MAG: Gfo/Idh/MocA family oxidoreductase [Verrucomicrobia bacterium]|nr:Gfo/Idh/MocA family oxidoreductase [Verrucomicrobiota bacterium]